MWAKKLSHGASLATVPQAGRRDGDHGEALTLNVEDIQYSDYVNRNKGEEKLSLSSSDAKYISKHSLL